MFLCCPIQRCFCDGIRKHVSGVATESSSLQWNGPYRIPETLLTDLCDDMYAVSHNCFYYTSKPECAIPDDNMHVGMIVCICESISFEESARHWSWISVIQVCIYVCVYIYIYTRVCIYIYTCVYIYVYIYTHTPRACLIRACMQMLTIKVSRNCCWNRVFVYTYMCYTHPCVCNQSYVYVHNSPARSVIRATEVGSCCRARFNMSWAVSASFLHTIKTSLSLSPSHA